MVFSKCNSAFARVVSKTETGNKFFGKRELSG